MLLSSLIVVWCTSTPSSQIEYNEDSVPTIIQTEFEEPTVEPEIPTTTDEEIVTQTDTSL